MVRAFFHNRSPASCAGVGEQIDVNRSMLNGAMRRMGNSPLANRGSRTLRRKTGWGDLVTRHCWKFSPLVAGALLLAACASVGPPLVGVGANPAGEYIIGPGDTLNVFVYRAPELSAEVPVRPDGLISTPLVPDTVALGRTPSQLAAALQNELKKYVKEPNVTVMVTGFTGPADRQVKVIGEVAQPLALPYRVRLSLLDVMIAAKGLTRFAAGNRAVVVRWAPDGPRNYNVRLDDLLNNGDISQNVAMQPGDILFIPQAWF